MAIGVFSRGEAQGGVDESYRLSNGLKVVLAPQPGNPVVSAMLMIKAGTASEANPREHGLAHLMEHMAFKGTSQRGVGEVSAEIENNGGRINAYTNLDSTVYNWDLPADQLDLGLDVLADIVFRPLYDPEAYDAEKEVVVEEIKRSLDNPDQSHWDDFIRLTFPDHPYGRPVVGTVESVRQAGRETALAFHAKFYRPDNAVLTITGGFDPDVVKPLVERHFAALTSPENPLAVESRAADPPAGPRTSVVESPAAALPKVFLGFRCAAGGDQEAAQLDLLSSILSQGRSGRLTENVKTKKALTTDIFSYAMTLVRDGVFVVAFDAEPDKILPALEAVLQELAGVAASPPSPDELSRSRMIAGKSFLDRQQVASGLGRLLVDFELYAGDYRLRDAYLPQWSRMTSADLVRLAGKVFRPENLSLSIMLPAGTPRPDEKELERLLSGLKLAEGEAQAAASFGFEAHRLDNGVQALIMRDPTLPLVTVKTSFMGGLLAEGPGQEGLVNHMAVTWDKSTQRLSAEELSRAVEDLGASVVSGSGRNTVSLSGSFLSANWRQGFELLAEVLKTPAFSPDTVEESRQEILAAIKLKDEDLSDRLFRLVRRRLWSGHPYGGDQLGLAETVAAFKREDLLECWRGLIRPEGLVVAVAGDVEPKEALELIKATFGDWRQPGESLWRGRPPVPAPFVGPLKDSETLDRAQTHLALTFAAPGLGSPDQAALETLDAYLSGMGGVLFNELRNKRSLAYGVYSAYQPLLDTGAFSFYIATDPQKTVEALTGIRAIIEDLRAKPRTKDEVDEAIRYLSGLKKIYLQTLESRTTEAVFYELFGFGLDYERRLLEAIEALTPEDLQRAAVKYLAEENCVMAVVGDQESVDASTAAFK
ncbi:MAG: insulinase family protein [Deltaproteobacteria bacterium]|nr:insulinase family protein [Deltaproteobacteria bacterium]